MFRIHQAVTKDLMIKKLPGEADGKDESVSALVILHVLANGSIGSTAIFFHDPFCWTVGYGREEDEEIFGPVTPRNFATLGPLT